MCEPPEDVEQVSARLSEELRAAGWKRVIEVMDRIGAQAQANGLTEAKLEELLADES